ncbi:MAG TPA: hypothetical protein VK146_05430 [Tabrizicola sp.]|nr:hypothetical protein [Tabrizicola sp.]
MFKTVAVLLLVAASPLAAQQTGLEVDLENTPCSLVLLGQSNPEMLNPAVANYLNGIMAGVMAAGVTRPSFVADFTTACRANSTKPIAETLRDVIAAGQD